MCHLHYLRTQHPARGYPARPSHQRHPTSPWLWRREDGTTSLWPRERPWRRSTICRGFARHWTLPADRAASHSYAQDPNARFGGYQLPLRPDGLQPPSDRLPVSGWQNGQLRSVQRSRRWRGLCHYGPTSRRRDATALPPPYDFRSASPSCRYKARWSIPTSRLLPHAE